jgi:cytoskeletal protein CcmA (bactofilin family)
MEYQHLGDGIVKEDKSSISNSTIIEGNIKAQEHLIINGTIKGKIEVQGYSLFLGPSGRLEGEVHAQDVRIRGHMKGEIKSTGIVQITKEANYSGTIESKGISVEQGAYFEASVKLGGGAPGTQAQKGTSAENQLLNCPKP